MNRAATKQPGAVQNATLPGEPQKANGESSLLAPIDKAQAEKAVQINQLACKVTGTQSPEFAHRIIAFLKHLQFQPPGTTEKQEFLDAVSAMAEMKPSSAIEALLATQMIGVHEAAVQLLKRALIKDQTMAGVDASVLRSTRLMRIFLEQVEAMQRLKGKAGQQKVIVEHVNVHDGGKAIVGTVTASGGGGRGADEENGRNTP
jgi:hypothetical protein